MRAFRGYVDKLDALRLEAWNDRTLFARLDPVLDGEPSRELKKLVSLDERREAGAFFTGSTLAAKAVGLALTTLGADSRVLDPSCGAGDLLLACTDALPIRRTLNETLHFWGERLLGRDLHSEFVRATKVRLALKALLRFGQQPAEAPDADSLFSGIQVGCGRHSDTACETASHIVLNPPFGLVPAPRTCEWGSGVITEAALFVESCVTAARPGTEIVAILPDVLRSGSRYEKWRHLIGSAARVRHIGIHGLFDSSADVDVFLLHLEVRQAPTATTTASWASDRNTVQARTVGDLFKVSVGAVVDYRDPHEGAWFSYASAKGLPAWQEVGTIEQHRRFDGRVIQPPFVAVRRTSRPGDKHRAIGTLIRGDRPVAVDNHLIVLEPRDGTLRQCRELLEVLAAPETTTWLDRRIRCRHLTVSAVASLPWRRSE